MTWIVLGDIFSGVLIVPLIKAIAANNFHSDIRLFKKYIRYRFYSIVLELVVFVASLIVLVNIVAWKQFEIAMSVLCIVPYSLLSGLFFVLEFHC